MHFRVCGLATLQLGECRPPMHRLIYFLRLRIDRSPLPWCGYLMVIDRKTNLSSIDSRSFSTPGSSRYREARSKSNVGFLSWSIKSSSDSKYFCFLLDRFPIYFFRGKESRKTQRWRWSVDCPDRLVLRLSHVLTVSTYPLGHTLN